MRCHVNEKTRALVARERVRVRDGLVLAVDRGMPPFIQRALLVLVTACGGSSSKPDAGPDIDAAPDAPQLPGTAITVETDVAPSLIAYRDGASGWKSATTIDVDTYELDVHGPYILTVACDDGAGNITTWQVARTPDDDREAYLPCSAVFADAFAVTGTMVQAGSVTAGFGTDRSLTANWDFDILVDAGVRDVFAFDANQIVGRRGISVTAATAITPALDLAQGTALVATPLVATNPTVSETVSAQINITSTNLTFFRLFAGASNLTKVAPSGFLLVGDRQSASVTARQGIKSRSVRRSNFRPGDPTDFTLPGALGTVAYAQSGASLEVTWSGTLPEHDIVDIAIDAFSEDFTTYYFHDLEISAAYIAATGVTTMKLDTEIEGYKPAWRIDYAKEYFRSVTAVDFRVGGSASSSSSENVNPPPSLAAAKQRRVPPSVLRKRLRDERRGFDL